VRGTDSHGRSGQTRKQTNSTLHMAESSSATEAAAQAEQRGATTRAAGNARSFRANVVSMFKKSKQAATEQLHFTDKAATFSGQAKKTGKSTFNMCRIPKVCVCSRRLSAPCEANTDLFTPVVGILLNF